jgi:DNA-binding MarR family transcriptional regulator
MVYMHHMDFMMTNERKPNPDVGTVEEVTQGCLLTRTRRISRVVTGIYDQELRSYGINAPQFSLLVLIARLGGASRAEIARANHQERSTSTRNLQLILSEGWAEEAPRGKRGRSRPVVISQAGKDLLDTSMPAWRVAQAKARRLLGGAGASAIAEAADNLPTEHPGA